MGDWLGSSSSSMSSGDAGGELPQSFLIPEPDDESGVRSAYVTAGDILGGALGLITLVALVASIVIAIGHEDPEPVSAAQAASRGSGGGSAGDGGSLDVSTAGGSGTDMSTSDLTGTAGDTAATGSGDASTGDAGAGTGEGGGGGGAATPASGAFKFAPPEGRYAATGAGFRANTPPGGAGTRVNNPTIEVKSAGGGCYDFKVTMEPDNHNISTLCGTADGGVVQTRNVQYMRTVIVGTVAEVNTSTMKCEPPTIAVPANPAAGQTGDAGGNCIGTNSSNKVPGSYRQTGTYSVVGKETVAGVEAIHVRKNNKMAPNDAQNTQNGVITDDYWYAPNGLMVRASQKVDATSCVVSCAAIQVKFHQEYEITVNSTTPG